MDLRNKRAQTGMSVQQTVSEALRSMQATIVCSGLSVDPSMVTAESVVELGGAVNDWMLYVCELQNELLGFEPDREPLPAQPIRPALRLVPPVADVVERIAAHYRPSSVPPARGAQ